MRSCRSRRTYRRLARFDAAFAVAQHIMEASVKDMLEDLQRELAAARAVRADRHERPGDCLETGTTQASNSGADGSIKDECECDIVAQFLGNLFESRRGDDGDDYRCVETVYSSVGVATGSTASGVGIGLGVSTIGIGRIDVGIGVGVGVGTSVSDEVSIRNGSDYEATTAALFEANMAQWQKGHCEEAEQ